MRMERPPRFRGVFRTDADACAVYSEAAGIGRMMPRAVAVPRDGEDASTLVRWARQGGHPLIARGSGSSMSGGAIGDGIVVDVSRMRELADADPRTRSIRADAGVLRSEVQRRAAMYGLRFPVDPSSGAFCTVGGMAATNAAGAHSLRHGATRPWVLALDCVFDDGTRATVRRGQPPATHVPAVKRFMDTAHPQLVASTAGVHAAVLKDSSGYAVGAYRQSLDLVDLLVGSEGTLALFTAVELALIPAAGATAQLFVSFTSLDAAVEAAVATRAAGAAACELLDRTFLGMAARAGHPLPVHASAEAALLIEVEGDDTAAAASAAERLRASLGTGVESGGMVAMLAGEGEGDVDLWSFRHAASPAIARLDPALRSMQFIEDAAVPPNALAAYVRGVRGILERFDTPGVIFGHAGDAHVHVNPLVDPRRSDWRERVEAILLEVTELVARLDGTLTGEHGDGRLRTPLLDRVWPTDARSQFAAVKQAFDPDGLLNPGVKVALPGQQAIHLVKYDPHLDALPAAAAAALATVERERAYARHRLELL